MRATASLGQIARVIHPVQGEFDLSGCDDVVDAVVGVITRHPMREEELLRTLDRWAPEDVDRALRELAAAGRAQRVTRDDHELWSAPAARYGRQPRPRHERERRTDDGPDKV